MKKVNNTKKSPKKVDKTKDAGELRKPSKLKPLKEKEKKNWKNNLDDDDDFELDDELKFEDDFDDDDDFDDEDEYFDDKF